MGKLGLRTVTLTEEQYEYLLSLLDFASGQALKLGEFELVQRLCNLLTAIRLSTR